MNANEITVKLLQIEELLKQVEYTLETLANDSNVGEETREYVTAGSARVVKHAATLTSDLYNAIDEANS